MSCVQSTFHADALSDPGFRRPTLEMHSCGTDAMDGMSADDAITSKMISIRSERENDFVLNDPGFIVFLSCAFEYSPKMS